MNQKKEIKLEFYLTLFGGPFGVHKFYKKKIFMGILYFFTCGLFLFGWWIDSIKAGINYYKVLHNIPIKVKKRKPIQGCWWWLIN